MRKILVTFIAFTLTLISAPVTNASGVSWTSRTTPLPVKEWNDIVYGNGQFIAVGNAGALMTSPDGVTWTSRTAAASNNWTSVVFANNTFVAVSSTGTNNRVMTSSNGITWTLQVSAANDNWVSVAYGNGKFVAIGATGSTMTSLDGITWTLGRDADVLTGDWKAITFGNETFVAVGDAGLVMTSADGVTWNVRPHDLVITSSIWLTNITFGNDRFMATGRAQNVLSSLDNGLNWSSRNTGVNALLYGIAYGSGLFVAVGENASFFAGESGRVTTSPTGDTWTADSTPIANYANYGWRSVAYANGLFVAVGQEGFKRTGGQLSGLDPQPTYPGNDLVMTSGTFLAPPAFTISSASESKTVNTAIAGYTISSTGGTVASYSISPAAPAGTTFNTTTGILSGTPTSVAPATAYTITATNTSGTSTQVFTLTVTLAPPAFTISSASESKTVNTAIAGYTISSTGGTVASYSISPAAPAGTTFNTTTGILSGTPTSVAPATAYTITATNTSGTSTQVFTLTVTVIPVVINDSAAAAKQQRELTEILSIIPSLGALALSLGETTKILTLQKCVKKKQIRYVKKGAKCPKGFVRKR